jgi:hypothetical protein
MRRIIVTVLALVVLAISQSDLYGQQPAEGENSFRLAAVNPRFLTDSDTITCNAGRTVYVAAEPDLDNDGKPEILVTEYLDGGRVFVFEVVGDNKLEYVWGSKKINPGADRTANDRTPRSVSVGDFDNNGRMEIHFQIGKLAVDTLRGHYIYEYTGSDNDYGTEPLRVIKFEEIDPLFASQSYGLLENPLTIKDVDGDNKVEMLFTPGKGFGNLETDNLYILEVESGTFAGGDASIRVEYKYTDMAKALEFGTDGYVPVATAVGDIDSDNLDEIVVLGWTNLEAGGGVGFLEISDVDTYSPGSLVSLSPVSIFIVKGGVAIVEAGGEKAVIIAGMDLDSIEQKIWVADNIASEAFISEGSFSVISEGMISWGIMGIGDQDHGDGSDGFDIYFSREKEIWDLEYNGSGALSDPANYTNHGRLGAFNIDEAYDASDGLFNSIFTYPGMDIDSDGNRDIVVGYKGACDFHDIPDKLEGELLTDHSFNIFVFEWGDSTQSIPISLTTDVEDKAGAWTVITPDDYQLEQNYPNPFNPSTNITFDLPLDKRISLKIFNSLGQEVKTLIDNQDYPQGSHTVLWHATDNNGNPVSSGVYVYKLIFGNFSKSRNMSLVR